MKFFGLLISSLIFILLVSCTSSTKKDTTQAAASQPVPTPSSTAPVTDTQAAKESSTKKSANVTKANKATNAAAKTTTAAGDVACVSGTDERGLSIKAKGEGCELEYTKMGQASMIASQIAGQEKCDEVLTKVKDKLVAAGYKCE